MKKLSHGTYLMIIIDHTNNKEGKRKKKMEREREKLTNEPYVFSDELFSGFGEVNVGENRRRAQRN
jgi:hypothetical protein